jgi:hypothetical protein
LIVCFVEFLLGVFADCKHNSITSVKLSSVSRRAYVLLILYFV